MLLDELDHVASSTESLSTLFSLVQQHSAVLRMIGIANTHTLTSSSTSTLSVQSLDHVQTCHFAPYTPQQLLDILQKRLSPLDDDSRTTKSESKEKFLPLPTLTLLTKKIAAQTGDVRALFEVLRGAIDIAASSETSSNPLATPTPAVTPAHILAALKAYTPAGTTARNTPAGLPSALNNEIVGKVHNLGLQARLVLLALILASQRVNVGLTLSRSPPRTPSTPSKSSRKATSATPTKSDAGPSDVDVNELHGYYTSILTRSEQKTFTPVSRSEFGDLVGVLETVGLVTLTSVSGPSTPSKSGRKGLQRTSSFAAGANKIGGQAIRFAEGIRMEEVSRGLGIDGQGAGDDARAAEVKAISDKERIRTARETKAENATQFTTFEDAVEN